MRFALRILGWGVTIYALMYLLWSGIVLYGLSASFLSLGIRILALVVATTIAARSLNLATWKDIVPYSVGWAIIAIALDALFLVPFAGWALYAQWSVWAGYALVAISPLVTFPLMRSELMREKVQKMPARA